MVQKQNGADFKPSLQIFKNAITLYEKTNQAFIYFNQAFIHFNQAFIHFNTVRKQHGYNSHWHSWHRITPNMVYNITLSNVAKEKANWFIIRCPSFDTFCPKHCSIKGMEYWILYKKWFEDKDYTHVNTDRGPTVSSKNKEKTTRKW